MHAAKDLDPRGQQINPFFNVLLNDKKIAQSQTLKRTPNPIWERPTEFLVTEKSTAVIGIAILDDNSLASDSPLGHVRIKLTDLLDMAKQEKDWFPLSNAKSGRVRVTAQWNPVLMAGAINGAGAYTPPLGVVRVWCAFPSFPQIFYGQPDSMSSAASRRRRTSRTSRRSRAARATRTLASSRTASSSRARSSSTTTSTLNGTSELRPSTLRSNLRLTGAPPAQDCLCRVAQRQGPVHGGSHGLPGTVIPINIGFVADRWPAALGQGPLARHRGRYRDGPLDGGH